jgi:hypothetical protein
LNRIVGIVPVRDEDPFIAWATQDAPEFCEELIVPDSHPSDRTPERLAREISSLGRPARWGPGQEVGSRVERALTHPAATHG